MLKEYNPQVVFFMETKISDVKIERVRRSFEFLFGIEVSTEGSRGSFFLA